MEVTSRRSSTSSSEASSSLEEDHEAMARLQLLPDEFEDLELAMSYALSLSQANRVEPAVAEEEAQVSAAETNLRGVLNSFVQCGTHCMEAVDASESGEHLISVLTQMHAASIRHSKLLLNRLQAETTLALAVAQTERDELLQQLQADIFKAEAAEAAYKRKFEAEKRRMRDAADEDRSNFEGEKTRMRAAADAADAAAAAEVSRVQAEAEVAVQAERARFDAEVGQIQAKALDEVACQICHDRPRNSVILPCSHGHYCDVCLQEYRRTKTICPTCRTGIKSVVPCIV